MTTIASTGLPAPAASLLLLFAKWRRLYSLQRDGSSFTGTTFLRKVEGHERSTLLVIQTTNSSILGAYSNSKWEKQGGSVGASFYGSALSCLFSLDTDTYWWDIDFQVDSYGKNRYIQVCDVHAKLFAFRVEVGKMVNIGFT